tara:strand:+ start:2136 stop:2327 length:192 start_codon:yes stop_codon:yes gene_type:complete
LKPSHPCKKSLAQGYRAFSFSLHQGLVPWCFVLKGAGKAQDKRRKIKGAGKAQDKKEITCIKL